MLDEQRVDESLIDCQPNSQPPRPEGDSVWVPIKHYIGEFYGGGIIVSVWRDTAGEHGLVASLTDINTSATWSNVANTPVGAGAQDLVSGELNSAAIIAQPGHTASTALLCRQYTGGGYTDWYLPAISELQQCYNAAVVVSRVLGDANGFQFDMYWSSTESNYSNAWSRQLDQGWSNGNSVNNLKNSTMRVRAVRRY